MLSNRYCFAEKRHKGDRVECEITEFKRDVAQAK
jgi:hypothetical protein